jgi:hypothetical protein
MPNPSLLYLLAPGLALDANPHLTTTERASACSIIERYLKGELSHPSAATLYQAEFHTTTPVDRVREILSVGADPLPAVPVPVALDGRRNIREWSSIEDTRLLAGVHRFGLKNWGSVAQFIGTGRTRAQCAQRWVRGLDPRISKNQWSAEDEDQLLALVREKGIRIWTQIASGMGNRSDVQCRYHFFQMYRDGKLPPDLAGLVAQEKGPDAAPLFRACANSLGTCTVPVPARTPPPPFHIPKQRPPLPPTTTPTTTQYRRLSLPKIEFPRVAPREHHLYQHHRRLDEHRQNTESDSRY